MAPSYVRHGHPTSRSRSNKPSGGSASILRRGARCRSPDAKTPRGMWQNQGISGRRWQRRRETERGDRAPLWSLDPNRRPRPPLGPRPVRARHEHRSGL